MIYWILLIASAALIFLIFLRRMRMTSRDLQFQKHLIAEESMESEPEMPAMAPLESVKKTPGSARKLFMKADAHLSRKEFEEAEVLLLEVIQLDESYLDAHHKLGILYLNRGDFPRAELFLSRLVNLKKDPVYFSNLGAALYQQQRLVEAAEAYESAIALDDKRAARLQSLAQVYYELGDDEKALFYFEKAAKKKPKDVELKLILADYYERLERYPDAEAQLKRAQELDPYNEEIAERLKRLKGLQ